MKKRNKALLVLLALVLVTGLGAKMYSNVTMGDDEWVGLAADAGRIVFDDQATDEVIVMDAHFGVGTTDPEYDVDIRDASGSADLLLYSTGGDASIMLHAQAGDDARLYWQEGGSSRWGLHYYGADYLQLYNYDQAYPAAHFQDTGDIYLAPAGGKIRVGGWAAPTYDLDVTGDIRATDDVLVNETVFIGAVEDGDEDGAHMSTRTDNDDGGYVFWSMRNVTAGQLIFPDRYAGAGGSDVGPETVLWAQWLVRDNTTSTITEGDAIVVASDEVLIAGSGANTLELAILRPVVPPPGVPYKGSVVLLEEGSHNYDVTLLMLWIKEN